MTVRDEECGQVIVFTLLSMTLLLGFLALAIDVGILFRAKRNAQIAADAAAVAGALDYKYNSSVSSAQTAGAAAATANGVTNGTGGAVVAINIPPKYGNYAGFDGFVEAVVTQPNSTFFMGMLSGKTSTTVGSRAVAGSGSGAGCIWTLARSGSDVSLTGSGALTASMCKIYDDSSASNALKLTGSGSISALSIGVAGNYSETGSGSINPTPVTGMAPAANPLNLTPPDARAAMPSATSLLYPEPPPMPVAPPGRSSPGGTSRSRRRTRRIARTCRRSSASTAIPRSRRPAPRDGWTV